MHTMINPFKGRTIYVVGSDGGTLGSTAIKHIIEQKQIVVVHVKNIEDVPKDKKGIVIVEDFEKLPKEAYFPEFELPVISLTENKVIETNNKPFYLNSFKKGGKKQKRRY